MSLTKGQGKSQRRYYHKTPKARPPERSPGKLARASAGEILRCAGCGVFPVELEAMPVKQILFQCPVCPKPIFAQKWASTREEACRIWNQKQALGRDRFGSGRNKMKGKKL